MSASALAAFKQDLKTECIVTVAEKGQAKEISQVAEEGQGEIEKLIDQQTSFSDSFVLVAGLAASNGPAKQKGMLVGYIKWVKYAGVWTTEGTKVHVAYQNNKVDEQLIVSSMQDSRLSGSAIKFQNIQKGQKELLQSRGFTANGGLMEKAGTA